MFIPFLVLIINSGARGQQSTQELCRDPQEKKYHRVTNHNMGQSGVEIWERPMVQFRAQNAPGGLCRDLSVVISKNREIHFSCYDLK